MNPLFTSVSQPSPHHLIAAGAAVRAEVAAVTANWQATRSMASSAATMPNSSIYTNYVNVHLLIDKLEGTNYDTWTSDIKL